jgi:hypothetical protein
MTPNPITRRGFPVAIADIERAKIAALAAGQSLNTWVQRAIRSALDAPADTVSVGELRAHAQRMAALIERLERVAMAGGNADQVALSGLAELRLDDGEGA